MQNSKQFLKDKDILPFISFKGGQAHELKLVQDKIETITGTDGKEVEGVKYKVIEGGVVKTFFTSSIALINKLADIEPDSVVKIQMKKRKDESGQYRSYFEVEKVGEEAEPIKDEDIPVISDESEPEVSQAEGF